MTETSNPIMGAVLSHPDAHKDFKVGPRGRPERSPEEAARRTLRRIAFGQKLRALREKADLSLARASQLVGMSSSRKLAQYETTCFPPGDVVVRLAPHYGVSVQNMCELLLSHSDPALYRGLTGKRGYEPSAQAIQAFDESQRKEEASE